MIGVHCSFPPVSKQSGSGNHRRRSQPPPPPLKQSDSVGLERRSASTRRSCLPLSSSSDPATIGRRAALLKSADVAGKTKKRKAAKTTKQTTLGCFIHRFIGS